MSLISFSQQIQGAIDALESTLEESAVLATNDSIALLRNRILNEKQDKNNQPFGDYSQAVVPKWYFKGKSLSAGAEERVNDGGWFQSYKDFREANNLPVDRKNYSFSGAMLRDIGIVSINNDQKKIIVSYGGRSERSAKLIQFNNERDDINLLGISQDERDLIIRTQADRLERILTTFLG